MALVSPERHIGRIFRRLRSTGIYECDDRVPGATKLCDAVIPGGHNLLFVRIDAVRDNDESGEGLAVSWVQHFGVDDCC